MKIKVWGCRGSICSPGITTHRYGGNTTCLELITSQGKTIVIDAGSGLRNLGKALIKENRADKIFFVFTHAHWDHLMGFPFFEPAYLPTCKINLCGGSAAQDSIIKYLSHQMEPPYFPVDFSVLKAKFQLGCRCSNCGCKGGLDGAMNLHECISIPLNHPNGGFGFRFIDRDKSFVLLTDNELRHHHEGGRGRAAYVEFCQGADLLFHDAQYTEEEYKHTAGWGHSTYKDAVDLALEAGVRRLGLFHHDPDRDDADLDHQVEECLRLIKSAGGTMDCFAVAESMEIEL